MKTINKIAPLALCASVATIVVPFASSCNGVNVYQEDLETLYKNGYTRKIEPLASTVILDDATKIYLKAINDNPSLIADDVFDYEGNFPAIAELPSFDDAKGTIKVYDASANVEAKTVNYTKELIVTAPYTYVADDGSVIKATLDLDISIDVINLPVFVYYFDSFVQQEKTYYY